MFFGDMIAFVEGSRSHSWCERWFWTLVHWNTRPQQKNNNFLRPHGRVLCMEPIESHNEYLGYIGAVSCLCVGPLNRCTIALGESTSVILLSMGHETIIV